MAKQIVMASSIGGGLEFFDFVIYIFLSPIIATLFFPHQNGTIALLATLGGYAVGYLARPIGGMIWGHFGDRIGRVRTLVLALFFMAIPTFFISCLPTYSSIGILAPILLILFRFAQGFSMGGDVPGAICFIGEHCAREQRGFMMCCLLFGMNMGAVLASLLVASLTSLLSASIMLSWGWRIPFLIGALLAIVGFYIRQRTSETPEFKKYLAMNQLERWPLKIVIQNHLRSVCFGFVFAGLAAAITSILSLFMATYMSHYMGIKPTTALWLNTTSICAYSFCCLLIGFLIDRFNAISILQIGSIATFMLVYPIFKLISSHDLSWVMLGLLMSAPLLASIMGSIPMLLIELFPTPIRYSGIGITYNVAFSLFAGTTPLLIAFLISFIGIKIIPAFVIMFFVMLALPFILLLNQFSVRKKLLNGLYYAP